MPEATASIRSSERGIEEELDRALMDTFPASDPISLVQPTPLAPDGADEDDEIDPFPGMRRFAIHPPAHFRGRPPIRSLDEAARAVHRASRHQVDERSEALLRRILSAVSESEAAAAAEDFRAWARERDLLIVPPEDQ